MNTIMPFSSLIAWELSAKMGLVSKGGYRISERGGGGRGSGKLLSTKM